MSEQTAGQHPAKLKWTGSIVDWVELIYGLHETGYIRDDRDRKAFLNTLFQVMGETFDFKVTEFANYFMNIKSRTDSNRTKFMDLMKEALLERMDAADRKPSRK